MIDTGLLDEEAQKNALQLPTEKADLFTQIVITSSDVALVSKTEKS
jgi:hypothetical protein